MRNFSTVLSLLLAVLVLSGFWSNNAMAQQCPGCAVGETVAIDVELTIQVEGIQTSGGGFGGGVLDGETGGAEVAFDLGSDGSCEGAATGALEFNDGGVEAGPFGTFTSTQSFCFTDCGAASGAGGGATTTATISAPFTAWDDDSDGILGCGSSACTFDTCGTLGDDDDNQFSGNIDGSYTLIGVTSGDCVLQTASFQGGDFVIFYSICAVERVVCDLNNSCAGGGSAPPVTSCEDGPGFVPGAAPGDGAGIVTDIEAGGSSPYCGAIDPPLTADGTQTICQLVFATSSEVTFVPAVQTASNDGCATATISAIEIQEVVVNPDGTTDCQGANAAGSCAENAMFDGTDTVTGLEIGCVYSFCVDVDIAGLAAGTCEATGVCVVPEQESCEERAPEVAVSQQPCASSILIEANGGNDAGAGFTYLISDDAAGTNIIHTATMPFVGILDAAFSANTVYYAWAAAGTPGDPCFALSNAVPFVFFESIGADKGHCACTNNGVDGDDDQFNVDIDVVGGAAAAFLASQSDPVLADYLANLGITSAMVSYNIIGGYNSVNNSTSGSLNAGDPFQIVVTDEQTFLVEFTDAGGCRATVGGVCDAPDPDFTGLNSIYCVDDPPNLLYDEALFEVGFTPPVPGAPAITGAVDNFPFLEQVGVLDPNFGQSSYLYTSTGAIPGNTDLDCATCTVTDFTFTIDFDIVDVSGLTTADGGFIVSLVGAGGCGLSGGVPIGNSSLQFTKADFDAAGGACIVDPCFDAFEVYVQSFDVNLLPVTDFTVTANNISLDITYDCPAGTGTPGDLVGTWYIDNNPVVDPVTGDCAFPDEDPLYNEGAVGTDAGNPGNCAVENGVAIFDPFYAGTGQHLISYCVEYGNLPGYYDPASGCDPADTCDPSGGDDCCKDDCVVCADQVFSVYPVFNPEFDIPNTICVGDDPYVLELNDIVNILAEFDQLEGAFDPAGIVDEEDFFITWSGPGVFDLNDGAAADADGANDGNTPGSVGASNNPGNVADGTGAGIFYPNYAGGSGFAAPTAYANSNTFTIGPDGGANAVNQLELNGESVSSGLGVHTICVEVGYPNCAQEFCFTVNVVDAVDATIEDRVVCASPSESFDLEGLFTDATSEGGTFTLVSVDGNPGVAGVPPYVAGNALVYDDAAAGQAIIVEYCIGTNPDEDINDGGNDANGCYACDQATVTILDVPTADLDLPSGFCQDSDGSLTYELSEWLKDADGNTTTTAGGGTWALVLADGSLSNDDPAVGTLNAATGLFDPAAPAVNTCYNVMVQYSETITDANDASVTCDVWDQEVFTICHKGNPSWTPPAEQCASTVTWDLNALVTGDAGGTWSGPYVNSAGILNLPTNVSQGLDITYCVGNDGISGCEMCETHTIEMDPFIQADISGFASSEFCWPGFLMDGCIDLNQFLEFNTDGGGDWVLVHNNTNGLESGVAFNAATGLVEFAPGGDDVYVGNGLTGLNGDYLCQNSVLIGSDTEPVLPLVDAFGNAYAEFTVFYIQSQSGQCQQFDIFNFIIKEQEQCSFDFPTVVCEAEGLIDLSQYISANENGEDCCGTVKVNQKVTATSANAPQSTGLQQLSINFNGIPDGANILGVTIGYDYVGIIPQAEGDHNGYAISGPGAIPAVVGNNPNGNITVDVDGSGIAGDSQDDFLGFGESYGSILSVDDQSDVFNPNDNHFGQLCNWLNANGIVSTFDDFDADGATGATDPDDVFPAGPSSPPYNYGDSQMPYIIRMTPGATAGVAEDGSMTLPLELIDFDALSSGCMGEPFTFALYSNSDFWEINFFVEIAYSPCKFGNGDGTGVIGLHEVDAPADIQAALDAHITYDPITDAYFLNTEGLGEYDELDINWSKGSCNGCDQSATVTFVVLEDYDATLACEGPYCPSSLDPIHLPGAFFAPGVTTPGGIWVAQDESLDGVGTTATEVILGDFFYPENGTPGATYTVCYVMQEGNGPACPIGRAVDCCQVTVPVSCDISFTELTACDNDPDCETGVALSASCDLSSLTLSSNGGGCRTDDGSDPKPTSEDDPNAIELCGDFFTAIEVTVAVNPSAVPEAFTFNYNYFSTTGTAQGDHDGWGIFLGDAASLAGGGCTGNLPDGAVIGYADGQDPDGDNHFPAAFPNDATEDFTVTAETDAALFQMLSDAVTGAGDECAITFTYLVASNSQYWDACFFAEVDYAVGSAGGLTAVLHENGTPVESLIGYNPIYPGEDGNFYIKTCDLGPLDEIDVVFSSGSACGATTDCVLTVNATDPLVVLEGEYLADPIVVGQPASVCPGAMIDLSGIQASPAGGVWTAFDGQVELDASTGMVTAPEGGTVTLTYTVTSNNDASPCAGETKSVSVDVPVISEDDVVIAFTNDPITICAGDGSVILGENLTAESTAGGEFSGDNVAGGIFSASGLAAGDYTVTYTVTLECGDPQSGSFVITVVESQTAAIDFAGSLCAGTELTLADFVTSGTGGSWTINGEAHTDATFTLTGTSGDTYEFTYTVGSGDCTSSATEVVTVIGADASADASPYDFVCQSEDDFSIDLTQFLTDGSTLGGEFDLGVVPPFFSELEYNADDNYEFIEVTAAEGTDLSCYAVFLYDRIEETGNFWEFSGATQIYGAFLLEGIVGDNSIVPSPYHMENEEIDGADPHDFIVPAFFPDDAKKDTLWLDYISDGNVVQDENGNYYGAVAFGPDLDIMTGAAGMALVNVCEAGIDVAQGDGELDDDYYERIRDELDKLGYLDNDHVVQLIGYGTAENNTNMGIFGTCDGPAAGMITIDINVIDTLQDPIRDSKDSYEKAGFYRSVQFTNNCWVVPDIDDSDLEYDNLSLTTELTDTDPCFDPIGYMLWDDQSNEFDDTSNPGMINWGMLGDATTIYNGMTHEVVCVIDGGADELYFDYISPNGDINHMDRLCKSLFVVSQIEGVDEDDQIYTNDGDEDLVIFGCNNPTYTLPYIYKLGGECGAVAGADFDLTMLMDIGDSWKSPKSAVCENQPLNLTSLILDDVQYVLPYEADDSYTAVLDTTVEIDHKPPVRVTEIHYLDYEAGFNLNALDGHCISYNYVDNNDTDFEIADDSYETAYICEGIEISAPLGTDLSCYQLVFYTESGPEADGGCVNSLGHDITYVGPNGEFIETNIGACGYYFDDDGNLQEESLNGCVMMDLYGIIGEDDDTGVDYPSGNIMIVNADDTYAQFANNPELNGYGWYGADFPNPGSDNPYGVGPADGEEGLYINTSGDIVAWDSGDYQIGSLQTATEFPWEKDSDKDCDNGLKDEIGSHWFPILNIPDDVGAVGLWNTCTGERIEFLSWGGRVCVNPIEDFSLAGPFEQLSSTLIDTTQNTQLGDLRTLQLFSCSEIDGFPLIGGGSFSAASCETCTEGDGTFWGVVYGGGAVTVPGGCGEVILPDDLQAPGSSNTIGYFNCFIDEDALFNVGTLDDICLDLTNAPIPDYAVITSHTILLEINSPGANYEAYEWVLTAGSGCGIIDQWEDTPGPEGQGCEFNNGVHDHCLPGEVGDIDEEYCDGGPTETICGGCFIGECSAAAKTTYCVEDLYAYIYNNIKTIVDTSEFASCNLSTGGTSPGIADSCRVLVTGPDVINVSLTVKVDWKSCLPTGVFEANDQISDIDVNTDNPDSPFIELYPYALADIGLLSVTYNTANAHPIERDDVTDDLACLDNLPDNELVRTQDILVIGAQDPRLDPAGDGPEDVDTLRVCDNSGMLNLFDYRAALGFGIFYGDGVFGNFFDPAQAGNGIHEIRFVVEEGAACQAEGTMYVAVDAAPEQPDVSGIPASMCSNEGAISLPGSGTWSGAGVDGASFSPDGLSGSTTLSYTSGANGCGEYTTSVSVDVQSPIGFTEGSLSVTCNADATGYSVCFDISSDATPSILAGAGSFAGSTFCSDVIACGEDYLITLSTGDACQDLSVSGPAPECCNVCAANPGTFTVDLPKGDDTGEYIFCSGGGEEVVVTSSGANGDLSTLVVITDSDLNIVAARADGRFNTADLAPTVGGSPLLVWVLNYDAATLNPGDYANAGAFPADACFALSESFSIEILNPVNVQITDIRCDEAAGGYLVDVTITGGSPEYYGAGSYSIGGGVEMGTGSQQILYDADSNSASTTLMAAAGVPYANNVQVTISVSNEGRLCQGGPDSERTPEALCGTLLAVDDVTETPMDTPVTVPCITSNDEGNGLTVTSVQLVDASQGTITWDGSSCSFVFTPASGEMGPVLVNYIATDNTGQSQQAQVTITITGSESLTVSVTETCPTTDGNLEAGQYELTLAVSGGLAPYTISGTITAVLLTEGSANIILNESDLYSGTVTDSNGETFEYGTTERVPCSKLVVDLIEYVGEVLPTGNELSWITASEDENDFFTLKHSVDGTNFTTVQVVKGAGTSTVSNAYSFLHEKAPAGVSYYQLSATDFDGNVTDHGTITLERATERGVVSLYPVPTKDVLNVVFVSNTETAVELSVYALSGQLMQTRTIDATNGRNTVALDVRGYAAGTYFLSVVNGEEVQNVKFVIE